MVHDFGILDVKLQGFAKDNIYYGCWSRMIERCYSPRSLARQPQYAFVSVCDQWRSFSSFLSWAVCEYREGWTLDKDLCNLKGDLYSPGTCCFIPQELNKSVLDSFSNRGAIWYGCVV